MKIAFAFWGITRSLKHTIASIHEKIFSPFKQKKIEYSIFMHTYSLNSYTNIRTKEQVDNVDNNEHTLLHPNYIQIDEQDKIKEKIQLNWYRSHPDPWNTNYNSVDNFILSMYSKQQVTRMIDNTKIQYDYIIFLRPDVEYIDEFDLNFLNHITNNSICIPNFHLFSKYYFNDRFCICNKQTYKLYGDIFDQLLPLSKSQPLHSETIIGAIMYHHKLQIIRIPFRFLRVRSDGRKEKIPTLNTC